MEPLSAAASAIAFAQATKQLVKFVRFTKSLADIPEDYHAFVKEVEDISELAEKVDGLVAEHEALDWQSLNTLKKDLENVVKCLRFLSEDVQHTSKCKRPHSIGNTVNISTIRWERKKSEIAKLRDSMRRTRDNLALHLQMLTFHHMLVYNKAPCSSQN